MQLYIEGDNYSLTIISYEFLLFMGKVNLEHNIAFSIRKKYYQRLRKLGKQNINKKHVCINQT